MIDFIFFGTMGFSTYTDIRNFKVYNWILYPAILTLLFFSHNYLQAFSAFVLMAILMKFKILNWAGGDIKLFMLIAAAKGWIFLPSLAFTYILVLAFRKMKGFRRGLPVAPFALTSASILLLMAVAFQRIGL